MGFLNHTECGLNGGCGNFTQFPDGGLVFWQGGGNWGHQDWGDKNWTMWRMMSFLVLMNKGKTVIGMPQSMNYKNKTYQSVESRQWMKAAWTEVQKFNLQKKIILTWRQRNSFESASRLYPLVENRLVPDIAFMVGPIEETTVWTEANTHVDILFFLRDDGESLHLDKRKKSVLANIINNNKDTRGLSFDLVDWNDRFRFYQAEESSHSELHLKYKVYI